MSNNHTGGVWPDHFDKILVSFFVIAFGGIVVYFVAARADAQAFAWAKEAFAYFTGMLSTLITGQMIGRRTTSPSAAEKPSESNPNPGA